MTPAPATPTIGSAAGGGLTQRPKGGYWDHNGNRSRSVLVDTEPSSDPEDGDSDKESDFADLDADPEYPGILRRLREQLGGE